MSDAVRAVHKLNIRYFDVITPDVPVDERSGEEIINRIVSKIEAL